MKKIFLLIGLSFVTSIAVANDTASKKNPFLVVLGIAQDAGYPQMGCKKSCCLAAWKNPKLKRFATSLALVDPAEKKWWLFEATPDIKDQLELFQRITSSSYSFLPEGIFITHAHMGHYTGLVQLGREVMNASSIPVCVMPRMKEFLTTSGPWSLLVEMKNITLVEMKDDSSFAISRQLSVSPFLVPHRDEFSETAGFSIQSKNKKVVFIPDIDKWEKFEKNMDSLVHQSFITFLDGTFYKDGEVGGRPMSEIPHPFITESVKRFGSLPAADKRKIFFIHFNHTNPLLDAGSTEHRNTSATFNISEQGTIIMLN